MSNFVSRRDFLALSGAAGAALMLPNAARGAQDHAPPGSTGPALPAGATVLFQGDSITDGFRNRKAAAPNNTGALGTSYPLLIASAVLRERPGAGLRFFNRGVSGDKTPDLAARWEADTIALAPDLVSVLVGVNDYWHTKLNGYTGTVASYESGLAELLEGTRARLPNVRLVLMEPFVLPGKFVDDSWFPEFDARREAAARVARRVGATWVPLQAAFSEAATQGGPGYWTEDGVHPTPAGHELIAERWRAAVGTLG